MNQFYVVHLLPLQLRAWAFVRWLALEFALTWVESVEFRGACFICAILFCIMIFITRLTFSLLHAQRALLFEFCEKQRLCSCNKETVSNVSASGI